MYWQLVLAKETATRSSPHSENERQRSVNDFYLRILVNLCSNWLHTSMYQILAVFTGKNNSTMLPAASWKWASTECHQFWLLHIWYSSHRANLRIPNAIIDRHHWQKYNIPNVKYRFQINLYCKLQSIQKHIIGCWKRHFDKIQWTNSKIKNLIWIYRSTCWQPAQFRQLGSLPLNRTRDDGSRLLTTRPTNLATVWFGPCPGREMTVRNRC